MKLILHPASRTSLALSCEITHLKCCNSDPWVVWLHINKKYNSERVKKNNDKKHIFSIFQDVEMPNNTTQSNKMKGVWDNKSIFTQNSLSLKYKTKPFSHTDRNFTIC